MPSHPDRVRAFAGDPPPFGEPQAKTAFILDDGTKCEWWYQRCPHCGVVRKVIGAAGRDDIHAVCTHCLTPFDQGVA